MTSLETSRGTCLPFGATKVPGGVNFSLFARHAEAVSLLFFEPACHAKCAEISLHPEVNRTGDVWHIMIHGLNADWRYGYRITGPWDPDAAGHYYSSDNILLDPYAHAVSGGAEWGKTDSRQGSGMAERRFVRRGLVIDNEEYDWEDDRPLNIPLQDTIIYELHVRGFTRHPSSNVIYPGTYAGIIEKIPYLKELGITAVELMPVAEFNENENINRNPVTGKKLKNFWGYSSVAFFAPKASYAVNGRNGNQVWEFKEMVKALHRAGIEVILDVVFNHTAEGREDGPTISFRGIDNTIYYLLDPETKEYLNFSGCGNTMNCNHPVVRQLIIDCLRYWVMEMHVDGFRFDLASILGRDQKGELLSNPPMVERIAEDPILSNTKIIAEAWDAAGLYQVGSFSTHKRWAEWNGKYRDDVRAFICGHEGKVPALATRMSGNSDLYQPSKRHPYNSINFVSCHDGFTLYDLVSYNGKHNESNGESNQDGENNNISWNSGAEGETEDAAIIDLRFRRIKSLLAILFLSQGVPMLLAGDEFGRTQQGNNNGYCQDNEISWIDWRLTDKNKGLLRFVKMLIHLRREHSIFRRATFFEAADGGIAWQGSEAGKEDWSPHNRILGFWLKGTTCKESQDNDFFVMLNGSDQMGIFSIPAAPQERKWCRIIDTAAPSPHDIIKEGLEPPLPENRSSVQPMAVVVLIARRG